MGAGWEILGSGLVGGGELGIQIFGAVRPPTLLQAVDFIVFHFDDGPVEMMRMGALLARSTGSGSLRAGMGGVWRLDEY